MIAPFEASKLRIARTAQHLGELEIAVVAYLAEKPCVIAVEPFPFMQGTMKEIYDTRAWLARIRKPVPLDLSAIIGDVVHNLRSTLDLLVCDLVRSAGKSTKRVYFPFCDTLTDLPRVIKERNLHHAGADVVDTIERLRPYKGGNVALRAVHDMDIEDKHRALLPVIGAATVPLADILKLPPNVQLRSISTIIVQDGQIIVGMPNLARAPALGTELPASFFLAVQDIPGLGNREVFRILHDLTEATSARS